MPEVYVEVPKEQQQQLPENWGITATTFAQRSDCPKLIMGLDVTWEYVTAEQIPEL